MKTIIFADVFLLQYRSNIEPTLNITNQPTTCNSTELKRNVKYGLCDFNSPYCILPFTWIHSCDAPTSCLKTIYCYKQCPIYLKKQSSTLILVNTNINSRYIPVKDMWLLCLDSTHFLSSISTSVFYIFSGDFYCLYNIHRTIRHFSPTTSAHS